MEDRSRSCRLGLESPDVPVAPPDERQRRLLFGPTKPGDEVVPGRSLRATRRARPPEQFPPGGAAALAAPLCAAPVAFRWTPPRRRSRRGRSAPRLLGGGVARLASPASSAGRSDVGWRAGPRLLRGGSATHPAPVDRGGIGEADVPSQSTPRHRAWAWVTFGVASPSDPGGRDRQMREAPTYFWASGLGESPDVLPGLLT